MKTQRIILIAVLVLLTPVILSAQSDFDKLYDKYSGKEGVTSINISPEMFGFLGGMDMSDSSGDVKNAQSVMKQMSGLKMISFENKSSTEISDFYKEIKKTIPLDDYAELMSVNDVDSDVRFLVKKSSKDKISELLMIVKSDDEILVMSMLGDMDMNTISQIGKSLDMKGMDKLDKIDNQ